MGYISGADQRVRRHRRAAVGVRRAARILDKETAAWNLDQSSVLIRRVYAVQLAKQAWPDELGSKPLGNNLGLFNDPGEYRWMDRDELPSTRLSHYLDLASLLKVVHRQERRGGSAADCQKPVVSQDQSILSAEIRHQPRLFIFV